MYEGVKLRVGTVAKNPNTPPIAGVAIPPEEDDLRDLPRIETLI